MHRQQLVCSRIFHGLIWFVSMHKQRKKWRRPLQKGGLRKLGCKMVLRKDNNQDKFSHVKANGTEI